MEPLETAIASINAGGEPISDESPPSHMRVSKDVWRLGQQVAKARGYKNARVAIETMIRATAHDWISPG